MAREAIVVHGHYKKNGNYEVADYSTLRGWADGMSLDKAKGRVSKIAVDYTKSFGR